MAFVLSSIAAANASGLSSVTNFTPIPYFLKVTIEFHQTCIGSKDKIIEHGKEKSAPLN
jgi:hypothetical protein